MKIVVISESIDIEDSSASKANVALIHNLKDCGYEIIVYHYTKKEVSLKGIECRSIKEIRSSLLFFLSRFQTQLKLKLKIDVHAFLENTFGFSFTFFNDVHSIKRIFPEIVALQPDLVLTLSKGMSFRPHYAVLSFPALHKKWMANIHDPFPFHYNPRPYNWVQPGYRQKETFFAELSNKAAYAVFPSQLLKEWMGSYFPNFLKTGIVIPHQNYNQEIRNVSFPDYFDASRFNLLHAGNLMKQRSPEGLIEGFKLFIKNNPTAQSEAKLTLLGWADYHTKMLEAYDTAIPQLYVYNGNVPFETVCKLQHHVAVNIILESKSEISPFLPGKFPHCVEADKPLLLLAPYYSETRRLLGNEYPYWSEVEEIETIASHMEKLYQLWIADKTNLRLNRPDLMEYCSATHLKKILDSI